MLSYIQFFIVILGTSNGTMAGLKNKVGGNCEKRNLKLEVYICRKNDTKCDQSRINRKPNYLSE